MTRTVWLVLLVACESPSVEQDAGMIEDDAGAIEGDAGVIDDEDAGTTCRRTFEGEEVHLTFGGLERRAIVHLPREREEGGRIPLLLVLHGGGVTPETTRADTAMDEVADERGFAVVYPSGYVGPNGPGWNIGGGCCGLPAEMNIDDVGFLIALADRLIADACVDPARVYSTGLSQGGFLSHRLACERSDRIAAIAPVAGVINVGSCEPSHPVAVLQIHGTLDGAVGYEGGGVIASSPSVAATVAGWVDRSSCTDAPTEVYRNADAHCDAWTGCEGGVVVSLCTIDGGGHRWPGGAELAGGGYTSPNLDASRAIADFVLRFAR